MSKAKREAVTRQLIVDAEKHGDHGRYYGMIRRVIRGLGRRVAESGDYADLILLMGAQQEADEALRQAVQAFRRDGVSWSTIGEAVGMTKQAAEQRWGQ